MSKKITLWIAMENNYNYFVARYYDSDLSVWLSVDPMASERSWVSPYNYCQNNPMNRVDPTGALDTDDLGWYETKDGMVYDPNINSQQDMTDNGIEGTYRGDEGYDLENRYHSDGTTSPAKFMKDEVTIYQKQNEVNYVQNGVYKTQSKFIDYSIGYPFDFAGGIYDFIDTYVEMRDANWVNSDKYFHSKANFKASSRGPGGEDAAQYMSNLREIIDQRVKGDSRQDALDDQKANIYGRNQGRSVRYSGENSPQLYLQKYRPYDLPSKY